MALVVEDGTGLANAESYYSVANTDTYFSSKRGDSVTYADDWTAATTAVKEACLRWATRLIDKYWLFDGEKSTTTQALRWPRRYVYDIEGDEIDGDDIPTDLEYATAEMARALLVDPDRVEDQEVGLSALSVGTINLTFDKYDRIKVLPKTVQNFLSDFGRARSGNGSRAVERA